MGGYFSVLSKYGTVRSQANFKVLGGEHRKKPAEKKIKKKKLPKLIHTKKDRKKSQKFLTPKNFTSPTTHLGHLHHHLLSPARLHQPLSAYHLIDSQLVAASHASATSFFWIV